MRAEEARQRQIEQVVAALEDQAASLCERVEIAATFDQQSATPARLALDHLSDGFDLPGDDAGDARFEDTGFLGRDGLDCAT